MIIKFNLWRNNNYKTEHQLKSGATNLATPKIISYYAKQG
jgi:hypothetical protein